MWDGIERREDLEKRREYTQYLRESQEEADSATRFVASMMVLTLGMFFGALVALWFFTG